MRWLSSPRRIFLLMAPTLIGFSVFVVFPVAYSLWYSFTDFPGFGPAHFVGLSNYLSVLHDQLFWVSLRNTGVVLVICLVVVIPIAFILALLLGGRFRGVSILRALIFTPGILAPILAGLIWVFILDTKVGLLDNTLSAAGLRSRPQWIGGHLLSPFSVALVFAWSTVGFAMTICYAGLQSLPADVIEAGVVDGATTFQQLRYITIPMMRETIAITTVLVVTNAIKIFELVYQLTGGGPVHRSEVLVSYMYFITFSGQQYGKGMALAVMITILGAAVSMGYLVLLGLRQRRAAA